jgi:hypothetical protein
METVAVAGCVLLVAFPFAALTALGARQRRCSVGMAILCGALFPVVWVAWYVKDERPFGRYSLKS